MAAANKTSGTKGTEGIEEYKSGENKVGPFLPKAPGYAPLVDDITGLQPLLNRPGQAQFQPGALLGPAKPPSFFVESTYDPSLITKAAEAYMMRRNQ